jgi:septum formation protein
MVHAPGIQEIWSDAFTLRELALRNAARKGLAVAATLPETVILAADTLVAINDEVIGKPRDLDDAVSMLQRLSGRMHKVCTAVFICHLAIRRRWATCEVSNVYFHRLTNNGIRDYLARVNPLDKAGAYAAQEAGSGIIKRIEGSFTNVVGLPMEKTAPALRRFGIEPQVS